MTPPLVDVTIATYNHEKYIAHAIESVLAQQTEFPFRILVGDDCSADNTQSIVRGFAESHPGKVETLLYSRHTGMDHPDRVGIRLLNSCTARYVALLDGDDYWTEPHKLQRQVDFLESHPDCALCFHNVTAVYEDGSRPPYAKCAPDTKAFHSLDDVLAGCRFHTSSVLFRRELLGTLPDWFHRVLNADWVIYVLLTQHGLAGYLNQSMSVHRIHTAGVWAPLSRLDSYRSTQATAGAIERHLRLPCRQRRILRGGVSQWRTVAAVGERHLGYALLREGDCRQALRHYANALRLRPGMLLQRALLLDLLSLTRALCRARAKGAGQR